MGLSNELFALGDSAVLTVLGQVSFMPVLVLAAQICPEVRACKHPFAWQPSLQVCTAYCGVGADEYLLGR